MSTRKTDGFAKRLGSLFGQKPPEKHVTPHIYISTASDVKKRKAKAKQRAAKEKIERETAAAAAGAAEQATATDDALEEAAPSASASPGQAKGAGKLLKAKMNVDLQDSSAIDEAALTEEEGFMSKVKKQKKEAPRQIIGIWSILRDRFSRKAPPMMQASTEKVDPIDVKQDSFLQHASAAPSEHQVRTESADLPRFGAPSAPEEQSAGASALDEAATGIRKVVTKKEESQIAKAVEENADLVQLAKPAAAAQADLSAPAARADKPVKLAKKKMHAPQFQTPKGFKAFLTSLSYIGMGKERMMFIQNMATMLNAGLPLTDSLRTLVLETRNRSMRKLIQRIVDAVENGSPLWRAMEAQSLFSLHALALVRIGEEAGNLAENMGYLAEQDEKDHALRSKVKMAMIYPTIVMVIMFIIVVGLGMFVLPNLVGVLFSLNVKLPLITRIVIWFSNMFTTYGAVGVPSFIGGFILLAILSKYTPLRHVTQWIMFKIPGIGKLAKEATIARFGVILGGLLKAGVPVVEALESLTQVTPIASYKRLYAQLLARVAIGDSFAKCFATIRGSQKLLPASVQQLVITGEKSGSLADIMLKIADIYDKKASETAEKLPIILEPLLLLFIGSLVGSIAFAIIIPIYSIVGNVGQ